MSFIESFVPSAATMGVGFFVGVLIGYALKKVIKIVAVIIGLFLAGLAYLQYHQIANINWKNFKQYLKVLLQRFQMQLYIFQVLALVIVSMAMLLQQRPH
jgi:uncharacterized membrane protein (Fun14 family)